MSGASQGGAGEAQPLMWITGAGGLIGHNLTQSASAHAPGWRVRPLTRADLDLADLQAVERLFGQEQPQLIIHCAAISKSPQCEAHPESAWTINVKATEKLSELAKHVSFIFFSSDLVFDGQRGNYFESDSPNPLTIYGKTKVAAEEAVLKNPGHTVIRTSLNAGASPTGDRAFNEELQRAWERGESVRLFVDEFRCPIPAEITARAVWELVSKRASGLYHLAGTERLSRLRIGELIASRCPEFHPKIVTASLRDYRGAPRSPDTSLNCSRVQQMLTFRLPAFSAAWLADFPTCLRQNASL